MVSVLKFFGDTTPASAYAGALHLDEANFATKPAKHVKFLRWTDDPWALRDVYQVDGLQVLVNAIMFYAVLSMVLTFLATKWIRRLNKQIEFGPASHGGGYRML